MRCALAITIFLAISPAWAETRSGPARVKDGDSLVVDGREIRLAGIDAPEMRQTGGRYSLVALRRHLSGRAVVCKGDDVDRYGRLVATCRLGGRFINAWLVSRGLAFAYWPFRADDLTRLPCPDTTMAECHRTTPDLMADEDSARAARRGLWHFDPLPVYPWCARHANGIRCKGP